MKNKLLIITLIGLLILTGCESKKQEESKHVVETNGMLSYTIDGEVAKEKPTKEDGYFVNKIVCDNGTDMMWDNDNWEVELTEVKSKDRCMVDFTKDNNAPGHRITVTSNNTSSLDSLSKATTENGTVIIYSKSTIKSVTGCNGTIEDNKVIVKNVTENQTCNIVIEQTLADTIKIAYPSSGARSSFSSVYTTTALHTATDYNASGSFSGTSYYFTGNPNNWVSFAGAKWRIIRINGNGSVRLLYAGSGGEDGYIDGTTYKYNTSYNHPSYVGWKYTVGGSSSADRGNANKSNAYSTVETWYNGLSTANKNYIDTGAIYCNDRNIGSGYSYSTSSTFYYAARERLQTNKTPTYECSNAADRFYNFGLMTADEVSYAGGLYGNDNGSAYYYLNASGGSSTGTYWWWTMSPFNFNSSGNAYVFFVSGSNNPGRLSNTFVYASGVVVRPVVSLKSSVLVTGGSGTGSDPYQVVLP